MKFAYFPGCNAEEISKQLDVCTRAVCEKLGIKLIDFDSFSCCGSGALEDVHSDLNLAVNARNFALAEEQNLDILTICSTCYYVMKRAQYDLAKQELSFINKILRKRKLVYEHKVRIIHFAELMDSIKLKGLVKKPLKNLRIAAFYGCHMLRPTDILGESTDNSLENLIKAVGATPLSIKSKDNCCGLHISLVDETVMLKMTGSIINEAKEKKADLIVTLCTLCHFSLDANQPKSEKYYGSLNVPVLFLPQLIGLAIGIDKDSLGIDKNIVEFKNG